MYPDLPIPLNQGTYVTSNHSKDDTTISRIFLNSRILEGLGNRVYLGGLGLAERPRKS